MLRMLVYKLNALGSDCLHLKQNSDKARIFENNIETVPRSKVIQSQEPCNIRQEA